MTKSKYTLTDLNWPKVSAQTDLYIVQSDKDIGQSDCEKAFGNFVYNGKTTHEVIQDPPSGLPTNSTSALPSIFSSPLASF